MDQPVTLTEEELLHLPCDVLRDLAQNKHDNVTAHLESCEECKLLISRLVFKLKGDILAWSCKEFPTMQALQISAQQLVRLSRKVVV